MSELAYKRTNVYEKADEKLLAKIFDYAEKYKKYLDAGKTEREACTEAHSGLYRFGIAHLSKQNHIGSLP